MSQDFLINFGAGIAPVVAAPGPRQFIRVLNYHFTTTSITGFVEWRSGTTVKAKDYLFTDREVKANDSDSGIFDCAPGEALNAAVSISGGAFMGGCGKYTILGGV